MVLYGHKEVTTFSYTHDDKRRMSRKGTKKMKKNYLGFGLVYCVLALVIFSVLMSFYTKKKIDVVTAISMLQYVTACSVPATPQKLWSTMSLLSTT